MDLFGCSEPFLPGLSRASCELPSNSGATLKVDMGWFIVLTQIMFPNEVIHINVYRSHVL